jgi:hypothetical protein
VDKFKQAPDAVLMIRPAHFGFNPQTAATNSFQSQTQAKEMASQAIGEFDRMVNKLEAHDIHVFVVEDTPDPVKPDAIFPNNWISFQPDGQVIMYPMMAENRRHEVRPDVVQSIQNLFEVTNVIDFSSQAQHGIFLEGTGSVVFDHVNKIAYASRSPRTNEELLGQVCKEIAYRPLVFNAVDELGSPVYHTNVVMCIGSHFVSVCLDAIRSDEDQERLLDSFAATGHKVVAISYAQMSAFAGNMFEVMTKNGEAVVLLSEKAYNALLPGQIDAISKQADLLPMSIDTIERVGGGSVRCMVAGIHLRRKNR